MKDVVKRIMMWVCTIALLSTAVFAMFLTDDTNASGVSNIPTGTESECVCLTTEEREPLASIIQHEESNIALHESVDSQPENQGIIANQSIDLCAYDVDETSEVACEVIEQPTEEENKQINYTKEDLDILALIIYQEAGADIYSDETRMMVGNVFLNRVASPEFPNTFYEVATAYKQYGSLYWTGIVWPARSTYQTEKAAVERAYDCARRLLDGERIFETNDVVWQAEFIQGIELVKEQDGIFFCR